MSLDKKNSWLTLWKHNRSVKLFQSNMYCSSLHYLYVLQFFTLFIFTAVLYPIQNVLQFFTLSNIYYSSLHYPICTAVLYTIQYVLQFFTLSNIDCSSLHYPICTAVLYAIQYVLQFFTLSNMYCSSLHYSICNAVLYSIICIAG